MEATNLQFKPNQSNCFESWSWQWLHRCINLSKFIDDYMVLYGLHFIVCKLHLNKVDLNIFFKESPEINPRWALQAQHLPGPSPMDSLPCPQCPTLPTIQASTRPDTGEVLQQIMTITNQSLEEAQASRLHAHYGAWIKLNWLSQPGAPRSVYFLCLLP